VQEAKIPSNSFFRFGEYICITSTDLKGGEKPPQEITKKLADEHEPVLTLGTVNLGKKKELKLKPSIQKDSETNVDYIIRKVGEKSKGRDDMEIYFETMFKNADQENSMGITFTTSEIGEAFVICMGKLEIEEKGKGNKGKREMGKERGHTRPSWNTMESCLCTTKIWKNQEFGLNKLMAELHRFVLKRKVQTWLSLTR
jgi:hypothetical protein